MTFYLSWVRHWLVTVECWPTWWWEQVGAAGTLLYCLNLTWHHTHIIQSYKGDKSVAPKWWRMLPSMLHGVPCLMVKSQNVWKCSGKKTVNWSKISCFQKILRHDKECWSVKWKANVSEMKNVWSFLTLDLSVGERESDVQWSVTPEQSQQYSDNILTADSMLTSHSCWKVLYFIDVVDEIIRILLPWQLCIK